MRKSKTEPIDIIIQQYLKQSGLEKGLDEIRLVNAWEELVGKTVAKATKKIEIRKGVYYVWVKSPIVKNELRMLKSGLIQSLNNYAGKVLIKDIVIR